MRRVLIKAIQASKGIHTVTGLLEFIRRHVWTTLLVILSLGSLIAVFLAPYGNATIPNCSFSGFLEFCGTITGGSSLFGGFLEASSVFTIDTVLLLVLLCLTFFEIGIPWVIATPWSEGRGLTGWAVGEGIVVSLGPWAGLDPTWGYWLITVSFWLSLVAARIRRGEVMAKLAREWEATRRAAEAQARQKRESQQERQNARDRPSREYSGGAGQAGYARGAQGGSQQSRARFSGQARHYTAPRTVLDAAALLGVNVDDSIEVIEAAYREWAKSLHPDVNPNSKGATKQMQRVNHARDTLLDYKRRTSPG